MKATMVVKSGAKGSNELTTTVATTNGSGEELNGGTTKT